MTIAIALLAVVPSAFAAQHTLRPAKVRGATVTYRSAIPAGQVRKAWLSGRHRTYRLRLSKVHRAQKGLKVVVRLSRSVRRRVGSRPRLVFSLRPAPARPVQAPARRPAPSPAPASPAPVSASGLFDPIPREADPVSRQCTLYASPAGSDDGDGSAAHPFQTAQKLADALRAGSVGCLRTGTYAQPILSLRHGGSATNRVVLRSAPGERAMVKGQIWVADGADFVTVAHLDHDATHLTEDVRPSPVVNGDDSLFYDLDVSSRDGVCFYIGDREWGVAERTVLSHNRIHNCGTPGLNKRHAIYLAQGVDTVIEQNWIYDNPDRGIQLYPNSTGAVIRGNVIDGNGEGIIFSGDYGFASSGNRVEGNLITNSRLRHDVESWYPDGNPIGQGNVVAHNCIHGGNFGGIEDPQRGFSASANFTSDPGYRARSLSDYRVATAGGCAAALRSAR